MLTHRRVPLSQDPDCAPLLGTSVYKASSGQLSGNSWPLLRAASIAGLPRSLQSWSPHAQAPSPSVCYRAHNQVGSTPADRLPLNSSGEGSPPSSELLHVGLHQTHTCTLSDALMTASSVCTRSTQGCPAVCKTSKDGEN